MTSRKRETLLEYTERAMEATHLGKLIPPIVYLPKKLRMNNQRLTIDNVRLTIDAPTVHENHIRIADADPLGFLIALMNGQPIPAFRITGNGSIEVEYECPDLQQRERVAQFLSHKVTLRNRGDSRREGEKDPNDWDSVVKQREETIRARSKS